MRFDKKFEYTIIIDESIDKNYDRIPSMLIQPYVENAIIHGLLPKEGAGKISITLEKQEETILCIIEDDGIGRKKSMEYKGYQVHSHKSRGMSITQERLDILNSTLNKNIHVEIIDLHINNEQGTRIKLVIPMETND
jgi:LytS/YehU family sensor histidine kinase